MTSGSEGIAAAFLRMAVGAMNSREVNLIGNGLAEDCLYEANGSPLWKVTGRDNVLDRFRALLTAFPNQRAEIISLTSSERHGAAEIHISETHTGELSTPFETIPPTGLEIDEIVAYFIELNEDDRVVRIGHYYDAAPMTLAAMKAAT